MAATQNRNVWDEAKEGDKLGSTKQPMMPETFWWSNDKKRLQFDLQYGELAKDLLLVTIKLTQTGWCWKLGNWFATNNTKRVKRGHSVYEATIRATEGE